MASQHQMQDPLTQYPRPPFEGQQQPGPGVAQSMDPVPDHGEDTYVGAGRLTGRKALITGGDSGIGRAAAVAFAREGADVAIVYLPSEEDDAKQVVATIEAAGRTAVALPLDITTRAACAQAVAQTVERLGGLDVLVNVAGKQQQNQDFATLTDADFDETYKTNVYAMFWLCQEALPHLQPGSTIINTSSVQAYSPSPFLVDYASTKAAINAFSKALAGQLIEKGIRVNGVAPGPVWTPLQVVGGQPADKVPDLGSQAPIGRPAQPAEMAPLYVFLAGQESSYVVGATLSGTGGMPTP